ncbi:uncharacterized protein LOC111691946 [Anoplophora glabripennis]|uniref:uncharacterized protein LOC111691946 n=1 Tax=Anoplophora glabripennis TaxID=217634 RepID=UPI000A12F77E|nr:uncharacterized protein LOC111691946 [Anoplophora glabripennis]
MEEKIFQTLEARNEFIEHLEEDIRKNNQVLEDTKKEHRELQETVTNLECLGKYPEQTSFIPLGKNIYMKGKIVHTGECYVKKTASPESYIVLKSLEQTLNSLQDELKLKYRDIEKIEYSNYQLKERMKLLKGNEDEEISEVEQLPKEIKSDKGVAVKVGEFYEILEFEEE